MKKYLLLLIIALGIFTSFYTKVLAFDIWPDGKYDEIKPIATPSCSNPTECAAFKEVTDMHNRAILRYNEVAGQYNKLENTAQDNDPRLEAMEAEIAQIERFLNESKENRDNYVDLYREGRFEEANQKKAYIQADYDQLLKHSAEALKIVNMTVDDATSESEANANLTCSITSGAITGCINVVIKYVSYYILVAAAWILGFAGLVLNEVIVRTIIGMREAFDNIPAITSGWKLIRDVGNSFFIFILIYVAITTILGINDGNTKRIIRNVIIVGLLVNFSLFFTKVLIDASNITTIYFHSAIVESKTSTATGAADVVSGFSEKFAQALGVTSLFNPDPDHFARQVGGDASGMIIMGVGGAIFLGVTAFAFLLAAVLLLIRFVVLIILLILSPIAYFGFILPGTVQYAKKWWNLLASQLMFAPLFMIMMFLVLTLSQTFSIAGKGGMDGLNGSLTLNAESAKAAAELTAAAGSSAATAGNIAGATGPLALVFNFVVIIGFMIFAIIISSTVASNTGGFVGSMVNRTRSNMIGASKWMGRKAANTSRAAAMGTARTAGNIAGAGVGVVQRSRVGLAISNTAIKAQNVGIGARQAVAFRGRSAANKLDSEAGQALKLRAEAGDDRAKKEVARLEGIASSYNARKEKQKANINTLINRSGSVSNKNIEEIKKKQDAIGDAKEEHRKAIASGASSKVVSDLAKKIKDSEGELGHAKRVAKREVEDQQKKTAAKMGNGGVFKTITGTKGIHHEASQEYLDKIRTKKKSPEEQLDEKQDSINDALSEKNFEALEKAIKGTSHSQIAKLKPDIITNPEVAKRLSPKALEAIAREKSLNDEQVEKVVQAVTSDKSNPGYTTITRAKQDSYWHQPELKEKLANQEPTMLTDKDEIGDLTNAPEIPSTPPQ